VTLFPRPIVAFRGISKTYPNGTPALADVSFEITGGEIHAICGENGAGKSTLMKILAGIERPTDGTIEIAGAATSIASPTAASALGIGMVHQHFSLIPSLTVAENVALGHEPRVGLLFDHKTARQRVRDLSERYALAVEPDVPVSSLSVAAQQKVEILKALSRDVSVLILDEPTAVLTPPETDELFQRLLALRAGGVTILFISHKLREVRALADRITVLRAGRVAGHGVLSEINDAQISMLVMGQDVIRARRGAQVANTSQAMVELRSVTHASPRAGNRLFDVNLSIRPSEILGIAGVDGSGQGGLVELLTGKADPALGQVLFHDKPMQLLRTGAWRKRGMAHLPADRFEQGGAPTMSLIDNALAGAHREPAFSRGPFLRTRTMLARAEAMIAEYGVRCLGPREPLRSLSGGNAQKLIAAREFSTAPKFLVVDQPTRGIDVAAAALIHERLLALARGGTAILLITADLDELLGLSDRVAVVYAGKVTARLENGPDLTPAVLGPYMLGLEANA